MKLRIGAAALALTCAACAEPSAKPISVGIGAAPELPAPKKSLLPVIKVATAKPWGQGERPTPAAGLAVNAFATGLDHPRWLYVLPNGDVLVAETNAPERPDEGKGIRGFFQKKAMEKAGATPPSANRITLLRDADGDGVAETRQAFLQRLNSPFGMALIGERFYVAETNAVRWFPYKTGETTISAEGAKLTDLPGGTRNHHWTKNIIASPDGARLYATVGSNSNAGEAGMAAEEGRAAIWEIDAETGEKRLYASGLRNPNGLGWSRAGALWTAVNERDEIGDDLVPDYITSVQRDGFYGWPYSYFGAHVDARVKPQRPDLVSSAIKPDYALGAHTASLGLTFSDGARLGPAYAEGAFIGQHGSWNRDPRSGYKVIFVPFVQGKPSGQAVDVLTGFLQNDEARGRPVGVAIARDGALLTADDVGNVIWRVSAAVTK